MKKPNSSINETVLFKLISSLVGLLNPSVKKQLDQADLAIAGVKRHNIPKSELPAYYHMIDLVKKLEGDATIINFVKELKKYPYKSTPRTKNEIENRKLRNKIKMDMNKYILGKYDLKIFKSYPKTLTWAKQILTGSPDRAADGINETKKINIIKLKKLIREQVELELSEGHKGAAIGYLVGVLIDFFMKTKKPNKIKSKTADELETELKAKLDQKYNTDPKFKELVDAIAAGKKVI